MRVLVVEDFEVLARSIATGLRREGMAVDVVFDGIVALEHLAVTRYDVIVLDRDIPGVHGDDICRHLAEEGGEGRVLMLTAASTIKDRVDGLGLGADDYLTKPFDFAELVARVRALGRRSTPPLPPTLSYADITLDPARRTVSRAGRRLDLSPKEFALLECLLASTGVVLSAEELLERVWDEFADPFTSAVKHTMKPPANQARRPPRHLDRPRGRLPARRQIMSAHVTMMSWLRRTTLRTRLAAIYAGLLLVVVIIVLVAAALLFRTVTAPPGVETSATNAHYLVAGAAIAIVLAVLAGTWLAWRAAGLYLRPLRELNATAREISATNLHRRLEFRGPDDELSQLGGTIDDLFGRLESSFESQRRFVASASHELRTPLAGQRTLLQVALANPDADVDELRAACEEALSLGERQERLIDGLLTLASSEKRSRASRTCRPRRHRYPGTRSPVATRAEERGIHTIRSTLDPGAHGAGDAVLLESMVANLLENAIQYNWVDGGTIDLTTVLHRGSLPSSPFGNSGPVMSHRRGRTDLPALPTTRASPNRIR